MAFPPAHALIAFGFAEVGRTVTPVSRRRAWLVAGAMSILPDFDFAIGIALGRPTAFHGDATHSLGAALLVGLVVAMVAGRRWALFAAAGYASHLLVDLLDDRGVTNLMLWWPLSRARPHSIAPVIPVVRYEQGEGVLGAARSLLDPPVLLDLAAQTAVGAVGLLLLLGVAYLVRRVTPRRPALSRSPSA